MPGVTIGDNAVLKNVIVDKYAKIVKKKDLAGTEEEPLYIGRRENI
jgi:glucose-1-phosphate adenylyltransferase